MKCVLLQDWVDVSGLSAASGSSILQSESCWLDMSGVRDIVAWLEIREATNSSLLLQTSPSKDISS